MIQIGFKDLHAYRQLLKAIADSSADTLTPEGIDRLVVEYSELQKSLLEGNLQESLLPPITDLEKQNVISAMNDVYLNSGRPNADRFNIFPGSNYHPWSDSQNAFAAEYVLELLDGRMKRSPDGPSKPVNMPSEDVIERSLLAFMDFTSTGHTFLYERDRVISDTQMRQIAEKLIDRIVDADFEHQDPAQRVLSVLTYMNTKVLNSAQNTWLSSRWFFSASEGRKVIPYDSLVTNRSIIPEAVQYARTHSPYLRKS